MKRRIFWISGIVFGLALLCMAVLLWTPLGLELALAAASRFSPVQIEAKAEGHLLGDFRLKDINVRLEDGSTANIETLQLDWEPTALLSRHAHIYLLRIGPVRYTAAEKPDRPHEPPAPPELPDTLPSLDFGWDLLIYELDIASVTLDDSADPVLESASTALSLINGTLQIDSFKAQTPDIGAELELVLDTPAKYQHSLDLTVHDRDGTELLLLTSAGDLQRTELDVRAPTQGATASVTINDILTDVNWLAEIDAKLNGLTAHADLQGTLSTLAGTAAVKQQDLLVELTELAALFEPGLLRLEALNIQTNHGATATAEGTVGLADGFSLDLQTDIRAPSLEDFGTPWLRELTIEAAVLGTPEQLTMTLDGDVLASGEAIALDAELAGSTRAAESLRAQLTGAAGNALVQGSVTMRPTLRWDLGVEANRLNPVLFLPDQQAEVQLRLTTSGEQSEAGITAQIDLPTLDGTWREKRVSGRANASLRPSGIENIDVRLELGQNRLAASGSWLGTGDVQVDAELGSLKDFDPRLEGSARADLAIGGTQDAPTLRGTVSANDISALDYQVQSLELVADIDAASEGTQRLELLAREITASGTTIDLLTANVAGPLSDLQASLEAQLEPTTLELEATANLVKERKQAELGELSIRNLETGDISLVDPTRVAWGDDAAPTVGPFCLAVAEGTLCVRNSDAELWQIEADALSLAPVGELLSASGTSTIRVEGTVQGGGEININDRAGNLEFEVAPLVLVRQGVTVDRLEIDRVSLNANGDMQRLTSTLDIDSDRGLVDVQALVIEIDDRDNAIMDATARIEIPELAAWSEYIRESSDVTGRFVLDAQASGPIASPRIAGSFALENATAEIPEQGVRYEANVNGQAGDRVIEIDGRIDSTGGAMTLDGRAEFVEGWMPRLVLRVEGDDFVVADRPQLRARLAPLLVFAGGPSGYQLQGEVVVQQATVKLEGYERGGAKPIGPSKDVVILGPDGEPVEGDKDSDQLPIATDIRILFDSPAELEGFGLEAELDGSLRVRTKAGEEPRGIGELALTGTYQAYGQDLTIGEGRLIYADTLLTEPLLRFNAYRDVDDVRAGLRISGRPENLEITPYSNPSMSESNILSYIVLGRPIDRAGEGEANSLSNAALGLAIGQSAGTTSNIGEKLGFADFGFNMSDDLGGAAFSVGRYLTPKLYLGYSLGLFESADLININYDISKQWQLTSEVGDETRTGVRYRIETSKPKIQTEAAESSPESSQ